MAGRSKHKRGGSHAIVEVTNTRRREKCGSEQTKRKTFRNKRKGQKEGSTTRLGESSGRFPLSSVSASRKAKLTGNVVGEGENGQDD